jgi:hypothetical protein
VANRDITAGEEILYDYGERREELFNPCPWLKPEPNSNRSGGKSYNFSSIVGLTFHSFYGCIFQGNIFC